MILAATILFATVFLWDLITDYNKWKKAPFDHKDKWIRGLLLLFPTMCLTVALKQHGQGLLFSILYSLFLVNITFWTLFDGFFNVIRKLPWNYVGLPDPWDAGLDKLQRRYGWLWVVKIIVSLALKVGYVIMVL